MIFFCPTAAWKSNFLNSFGKKLRCFLKYNISLFDPFLFYYLFKWPSLQVTSKVNLQNKQRHRQKSFFCVLHDYDVICERDFQELQGVCWGFPSQWPLVDQSRSATSPHEACHASEAAAKHPSRDCPRRRGGPWLVYSQSPWRKCQEDPDWTWSNSNCLSTIPLRKKE